MTLAGRPDTVGWSAKENDHNAWWIKEKRRGGHVLPMRVDGEGRHRDPGGAQVERKPHAPHHVTTKTLRAALNTLAGTTGEIGMPGKNR